LLERLRRRHAARLARGGPYFSPPPGRILFLCFGNICRSPFAEVYWNRILETRGLSGPRADSAGFFNQFGRRAPSRLLPSIREMGLDLTSHRSCMATAPMIRQAGAIFVMDAQNWRDLARTFPDALDKTFLLGLFAEEGPAEIADPYTLPEDQARAVYGNLARALDALAGRLVP
jgi:protein-tyrosine phosphatase